MRLAAYLSEKGLSPARFGKLREPPISRVTIRQWALGQRFPSDPATLAWIEQITAGAVTPADFVAHTMEVRQVRPAADPVADAA